MAICGNRAMGDLSAAVAVWSLSAAVCKLLPEGSGAEASLTKAQLCTMRDPTFVWPSPDEVRPEALHALPKNIAKNFTLSFLKTHGRELVRGEAERLRRQVSLHPLREALLCFEIALNQVSFSYKTTQKPSLVHSLVLPMLGIFAALRQVALQ